MALSEADLQAAYELALEQRYWAAVRFLRSEIGYSLREAADAVNRLVSNHPESVLALSLTAYRVKMDDSKSTTRNEGETP